MKTVTCLLFLFMLINSKCQIESAQERKRLVVFDLGEMSHLTAVRLSDLGFVDIEYIPLETTEKSHLRTINIGDLLDRLIFYENYFIIKQFQEVLKFNSDGSFITKVGTRGRGPEEFQICHDVAVDDNDQIYIADGQNGKLLIFDKNGNILRTTNLPLHGTVEIRIVNGRILCYNENHLGNVRNSFNLIDTDGVIIKSFPNRYSFVKNPNSSFGFSHENLFYNFNNNLFKKEVYSDTVYVYDNMEFKSHLVIKAGHKLITPEARSEMASLNLMKNYISPRNLFEFGDFVYYEFWNMFDFSNTEIYGFIGSKKNNYKVLIDPSQGIINDLDGGPNITPLTIKNDVTMVGCIDVISLKNHITSDVFKNSFPRYPEKKEELEQLANSLKETDNPVLMLVRLKK